MTQVPAQGHELNALPVDHGNTRAGDVIAAFRRNNPIDPNDLNGQVGRATLAEADPVTLQGEIDALTALVTALTARVAALEGGGVAPPVAAATYWIGLTPDATVTSDELTDSTMARTSHILTVPDIPTGQMRHVIISRPASLGAFTYVYYYPANHRDITNGIGGWMSVPNVVKDGIEQVVLISRAILADTASGRIIEAG